MKPFYKVLMIFQGVVENVALNDTIMGLNNIDKHQYLQGINCSCKLHDY